MPQTQDAGTKVTEANSTSKTTKSVGTQIGDQASNLFQQMLASVFGGDKTVSAPAVDQPGSRTPGVVGGLPPNMVTPPSRLATPPLLVPIQPRQQLSPSRGVAPAGSSYGVGGASEAAGASFGDSVVQAIQASRAKKESDQVTKAQNSLNMFLHAVQQNDMQVANLLASDPKVTASWEKYLKMQFPRQAGNPTKQEATPLTDASAQLMPTQSVPGAPGTGNVNEPGGIAIPTDQTPEGKIRAMQLAAIQKSMESMSPQQIAATASVPGMNMNQAALSPEEFRKKSLMENGIALTAEQDASINAGLKAHMATTWGDIIKSVSAQESMTQRTGMMTQAQKDVADKNRDARLKVAQAYIKGNKDIAKLKGNALETATYVSLINGQNALAVQAEKELKDIPETTYGGLGGPNSLYTAKKAEVQHYQDNAAQIQKDYDGFKIASELGVFDQEAAKPDENVPAITPEQ